jgi:hypothetical protein
MGKRDTQTSAEAELAALINDAIGTVVDPLHARIQALEIALAATNHAIIADYGSRLRDDARD